MGTRGLNLRLKAGTNAGRQSAVQSSASETRRTANVSAVAVHARWDCGCEPCRKERAGPGESPTSLAMLCPSPSNVRNVPRLQVNVEQSRGWSFCCQPPSVRLAAGGPTKLVAAADGALPPFPGAEEEPPVPSRRSAPPGSQPRRNFR